MAPSGFMMDSRRLTKTALDVHGRLQVRLHQQENDTWLGYIEDPRLGDKDDIGALYYVIAVIFIYGLSIVMMIASHIRKNKQDCQLRAYLKEMAVLRKADRREKLMGRITTLASTSKVKGVFRGGDSAEAGGGGGGGGSHGGRKEMFKLGSCRSNFRFHLGGHRGLGKKKRREIREIVLGKKQESRGGGRGKDDGGGGGGGGGGGLSCTPTSEEPRQILMLKRAEVLTDDDAASSRLQEDGNETADSENPELPADLTLDMSRLAPSSANVSPLTSASATPSPPPRNMARASSSKVKAKITFEDEGFVL